MALNTPAKRERLTPLSAEQLDQYNRDGYIILPQSCSHDLIDAFNSYAHRIQLAKEQAAKEQAQEQAANATQEPAAPARKELPFTPHVFNYHLNDGFYLEMMKLPVVRGAITQILGDEAVGIISNYMFKDPGSPGTAPHQDYYYIHNEPNTLIAAWIALEDVDVDNGCLWALPGSHKLGLLPHGDLSKQGEYDEQNKEVESADLAKQIPLVMRKGDIVIFHNLLIHSSLKNTTADRYRKCYVCHYIRHDSKTFRDNMKNKIALD